MPFDLSGISVPMWALLAFFGLFLAFFLLYSLFNLYHLLRYGTFGIGLYGIIALFLFGSGVLLAGTYGALSQYDWSENVAVSDYVNSEMDGQFFPGF